MNKDTAKNDISTEKHGASRHTCFIYKTREEQFSSITPVIKDGLANGEKCIYIADDNTVSAILDAMQTGGIDADSATASGVLTVVTKKDVYRKSRQSSSAGMLRFLEMHAKKAKVEGFTALRAVGEMTWTIANDGDAGVLEAYESGIHGLFHNHGIRVVCQYNYHRFPPETIIDVLSTHPAVLSANAVYSNPYYIPPYASDIPNKATEKLNRMLSNISDCDILTVTDKSKRKRIRNRPQQANEWSTCRKCLQRDALERSNKELQNKLAELNRIKGEHRKLTTAVEQSPCVIIITNVNGSIEYVNPKFTQLTGYAAEEVLGGNPKLLKSGHTGPEEYKHMWETITAGKEWYGEFCNKKKNGDLYWESTSISPIKNNGEAITHFIAIKEDITERKRTQEVRTQSKNLKALGVMAAGVAHQFNNILAIIDGNAQMLVHEYGDHGELTQRLGVVREVARDGAAIIRRLIDFSRVESDASRHVPVDIKELVTHVVQFSKPRWKDMAQAEGITYHINMNKLRKTPLVRCNPSELREVLINIINNALDAMRSGGTLSFESWNNASHVYVSISDTGYGMSEDVTTRVFDPFFSTKEKKGCGLGLSVAYSIMNRHGGKIDVKSIVGKGSTFILEIPATGQGSAMAAPAKSMLACQKNRETKDNRILVVDDEEKMCNCLHGFLTKEGYKVVCVNNGSEAIAMLENGGFSLVLCDLGMPEISGWDVMRAVMKKGKRPGFGLMTGWGKMPENIVGSDKDITPDFIINKPFEFSELLDHIHRLLASSTGYSQTSGNYSPLPRPSGRG